MYLYETLFFDFCVVLWRLIFKLVLDFLAFREFVNLLWDLGGWSMKVQGLRVEEWAECDDAY